MNNKNVWVSLAVIVVIGGGLYLLMNKKGSDDANSTPPVTTTDSTDTTTTTSAPVVKTSVNTTTPPAPTGPVTRNIGITNYAFSQPTITINPGDTIVWTNNDDASHTITGPSAMKFGSTTLKKGQDYKFTFNNSGTYYYHCQFHPSMTGTVIVR